jgi:hypothetical protein
VAQQVWVDALADPGGDGHGANDLADPLARQNVWRWPGAFLTAGKQRSRPSRTNYVAAATAPGLAGSAPPGAFHPCPGG